MSAWLKVRATSQWDAVVNGPGASLLIAEAGGKIRYSPRENGYVTSAAVASRVMDLAGHQGRRVRYIDHSGPRLDFADRPERRDEQLTLDIGGAT